MKLIIDIPEEDYRECKFRKDLLSLGEEPTDLTFNMRMETLIANGTPLSEEIEKIKDKMMDDGAYFQEVEGHTDFVKGISHCIDIAEKELAELKGDKK